VEYAEGVRLGDPEKLLTLKGQRCQLVALCQPGLTYIKIFDTRALW